MTNVFLQQPGTISKVTYSNLNEEITDVFAETRNFLVESKQAGNKHLDLGTKFTVIRNYLKNKNEIRSVNFK